MSQLVVALAWCWAQGFVVAALAIALSALAARRSPAAGATIALAGVLAALTLAVLAPVPLPRWALPGYSEVSASRTDNRNSATRGLAAKSPALMVDEPPAEPRFRLPALHEIAGSLRRSESAVASNHGAVRMALGLFLLALTISLARLACGLATILALRRQSDVVMDARVADLLSELQRGLGLRWLPQVRQSGALVSAAVVGWRQPAIILPQNWRQWSPIELKAVLAHELAHALRRDFLVRLIAGLAVALQCGQPLVYWLRRQLILSQELAADELAASAVGGRAEYVQALARLALVEESRAIAGPAATLLPVFSGFLLRRIEMLRAKDGSAHRGAPWTLQWSATAVLVTVAIGTTAMRGLAQAPQAQPDESVRVAKANDARPNTPLAAADSRAQAAGLFQRPAFDLTSIAVSDRGGFCVRLGEFLGRSGLEEFTRKQNESLAKIWKDTYPTADALGWSLQDIEYIAGDFFLTVKHVSDAKEGQKNQIMFGSTCVFIRWRKPLNGQFESLLRAPGAVEKSHRDITYAELPIIPFLGPTKPCVCRIDDWTILWTGGEDILLKRLDKLATQLSAPAWQGAWKSVERGWLTLVAGEAKFDYPPGVELDESAQLTKDLFGQAPALALGADWHGDGTGNSAVKMQFRYDTEEEADLARTTIERMIELGVSEIGEAASKSTDERTKGAVESYAKFLRGVAIETRATEAGWQVDVRFAGPVDVQSILNP